jgi:hypothetical protein
MGEKMSWTSTVGASDTGVMDRCQRCGSPQEPPYTVVSGHFTSEGALIHTRCACGALRPRLLRYGGRR